MDGCQDESVGGGRVWLGGGGHWGLSEAYLSG